jgi:hypothetical protein
MQVRSNFSIQLLAISHLAIIPIIVEKQPTNQPTTFIKKLIPLIRGINE